MNNIEAAKRLVVMYGELAKYGMQGQENAEAIARACGALTDMSNMTCVVADKNDIDSKYTLNLPI